jgi:hypothetical protein
MRPCELIPGETYIYKFEKNTFELIFTGKRGDKYNFRCEKFIEQHIEKL